MAFAPPRLYSNQILLVQPQPEPVCSTRLPRANRTYFQCEVAICRGECQVPDCSTEERQVAVAGGPLSTLVEGQDTLDQVGSNLNLHIYFCGE